MKILKLEIDGFRSFKSQTWCPEALNVVIGPNASGKSNLLRVLELLSAAASGRLGKYVQQQGGMDSLVYDGRVPEVRVKARMLPIPPYEDIARDSLNYEIVLGRMGSSSAYRIVREVLVNELGMPLLKRDPHHAVVYSIAKQAFVAPTTLATTSSTTTTTTTPNPEYAIVARPESVEEEESLLASVRGPFAPNRFAAEFGAELASWSVFEPFSTDKESTVRQANTARHDVQVQPNGQNLVTVLHTLYYGNREFKEELNAAMRAAFGEDFEELTIPPAADQRVQLRVRWRSLQRDVPSADLSDGTLRFLYLLAILANPNPPPLIAIDEPETGLHPSMLRIVAEYARDAANRTQVILTTHSPELLDAFGDEPPTTTVVEWQGGQTGLRVLHGDNLDYWLKKYTLGELYRSWQLEAMT
jgi:predicted ATPase